MIMSMTVKLNIMGEERRNEIFSDTGSEPAALLPVAVFAEINLRSGDDDEDEIRSRIEILLSEARFSIAGDK
jgi:hypothetical protein